MSEISRMSQQVKLQLLSLWQRGVVVLSRDAVSTTPSLVYQLCSRRHMTLP